MIIFELACSRGHRFEGWFASADDFAGQSDAAMVICPVCDVAEIAIVPSAKIHVAKPGTAVAPAPAATTDLAATDAVTGLPMELLRQLREAVRNTEDVGRRFPEEARKIHYDEAPTRAIRGQASPNEAAALREEGIDFAALPPFLTRDSH